MAEGNQGQAVSLGCGTLILIALIVLFFSNPGKDDVLLEVGSLRSEVRDLRKLVEEQSVLIKTLQPKAKQ
jgi:hypothetical protein